MKSEQEFNALQERKNTLASTIKEKSKLYAEQGDKWIDDEQRSNWDQLNKDYDAVSVELDTEKAARKESQAVAERAAQVTEDGNRSAFTGTQRPGLDIGGGLPPGERRADGVPTEEQRSVMFNAWCRSTVGMELTRDQVDVCNEYRFNPYHVRELKVPYLSNESLAGLQRAYRSGHHTGSGKRTDEYLEQRTLSSVNFATGGAAAVPESFRNTLERNLLAFGGITQLAETISTATRERITWPSVDDTTNQGERIGENVNIDNSGSGGPDPSFSAVSWDAYKYSSKVILVPNELLQDDMFNLPNLIAEMAGERIGRKLATDLTTGDGINGPKGLITAAGLGRTHGATTLTGSAAFDSVIHLEHSIAHAYRGNSQFMCNDGTVKALRLIRDSDGYPLWVSGRNTDSPDTLHGQPLFINHELADIAASAKVMTYGPHQTYKIRRAGAPRFYRLQELYRASDKDGFVLLLEADGNLWHTGTARVNYLQMSA